MQRGLLKEHKVKSESENVGCDSQSSLSVAVAGAGELECVGSAVCRSSEEHRCREPRRSDCAVPAPSPPVMPSGLSVADPRACALQRIAAARLTHALVPRIPFVLVVVAASPMRSCGQHDRDGTSGRLGSAADADSERGNGAAAEPERETRDRRGHSGRHRAQARRSSALHRGRAADRDHRGLDSTILETARDPSDPQDDTCDPLPSCDPGAPASRLVHHACSRAKARSQLASTVPASACGVESIRAAAPCSPCPSCDRS